MKYLFPCLFIFLLSACQQPGAKSPTTAKNKFYDETLRTIYTFQDQRNSAQLLSYFQNPSATYREAAALAFASLQDKTAVPQLAALLEDPEASVRKAAAYALGQTADTTAENYLLAVLNKETNKPTRAEMFEALGKVATKKGVEMLTNYDTSDSIFQAGQAWGLYRAALKGMDMEKAYPKVTGFLTPSHSRQVRIAAANTLARSKGQSLKYSQDLAWRQDGSSEMVHRITYAAEDDVLPGVRSAAVTALGKSVVQSMLTIIELIERDQDYRVRIAAIRATKDLDDNTTIPALLKALSDENALVRLTAAELLTGNKQTTYETLVTQAKAQTDWRTRALLYGAALKTAEKPKSLHTEITNLYHQTQNIYEKGALLSALSNDVNAYQFLETETFNTKNPVISTYGIEALGNLRKNKNFPANLQAPFTELMKKAVASGDVALVGTAATLLREPELNFKQTLTNFTFLKDAQSKINLPRDVETYIELQKTIAYFEGKPNPEPPKTPATNAIDWNLVQSLPKDQKVRLKTSQGDITFQLYVEEAPGSVANFVTLVNKGFYNGLNFHRVVPNFVAQGGDPRGDGWGGTDYTIRSEFANLHYEEGTVGLASAGKDTESCQWFITHNYVPHLDGRYTIFAKVISGLEVVHKLNISDKILKAELVK